MSANKSAGSDIARGVPAPVRNQLRTGSAAQSPTGARPRGRTAREAQRQAATRQGASGVRVGGQGRQVKK